MMPSTDLVHSETEAQPSQTPSVDQAKIVGARLKAEFARLLTATYVHPITAAELARALSLNHQLCNKLINGARQAGDPLQTLRQIPGVEGLNQFLDAIAPTANPAALAAAKAAVNEYAEFLRRAGGSQRRLLAWLDGISDKPAPAPGPMRVRQQLFESASAIRGCRADVSLSIQLINPMPDSSGRMEKLTALSKLRIRREATSLPMVLKTTVRPDEHQRGNLAAPQDASNQSLFARFSSQPLPPMVTREQAGATVTCVDPDRTLVDPIDVALGPFRSSGLVHPREAPGRVHNTSSLVSIPSEWLIADFYLHRQLAAGLIPQAGAYNVGTEGLLAGAPEARWYDRLPGSVELRLLGRGTGESACEQYARHTEFTRALFEAAKWDPDEFVGYRIAVRYPICFAQYVVSFEFNGA